MTDTLLDLFLKFEAYNVIGPLREGLREPAPQIRHFNFNLFDVTIDHEQGTVTIEDVAAVTAEGILVLPIAEFRAALDRMAESS